VNAGENTEQGARKLKNITDTTNGFFQDHAISLTKQVGVEVTPEKAAMVAALKNTFGTVRQE
jgi:hypothetical protein